MPLLTELTLPSLPVDSADFHKDPFHFTDQARQQHPWLAKFSQGYIVHGYQAAKDLAMMDQVLQMSFSGLVDFYDVHGTPWAQFMEDMLLTSAGGRHKRLRDSVAEAFTPRRANETRGLMQRVIRDLLDEWAPKGQFDFADFAAHFPIAVMCGLLGMSEDPIPVIRKALDVHMASLAFDPALNPAFLAAYDEIWNFANSLVIKREKRGLTGDGSELDAMIAAKNTGQIDETELRFMLMTLLVAGYDTSRNMLGVTMLTLLDHPEMLARCAEDRAFCTKVIEEMLRYCSIATLFREVVEEFDYDGIRFPKGVTLAFAFPLTGRDPAAFPDPATFDPERVHGNRHAAFGRGSHMCLGQFLARALLEEGLHQIAQRLANPRLTGKPRWKPFLGAWGLESLPIAFDLLPMRQLAPDSAESGLA